MAEELDEPLDLYVQDIAKLPCIFRAWAIMKTGPKNPFEIRCRCGDYDPERFEILQPALNDAEEKLIRAGDALYGVHPWRGSESLPSPIAGYDGETLYDYLESGSAGAELGLLKRTYPKLRVTFEDVPAGPINNRSRRGQNNRIQYPIFVLSSDEIEERLEAEAKEKQADYLEKLRTQTTQRAKRSKETKSRPRVARTQVTGTSIAAPRSRYPQTTQTARRSFHTVDMTQTRASTTPRRRRSRRQ